MPAGRIAALIRRARRALRATSAILPALFGIAFVAGFTALAIGLLIALWFTADYAPPGALALDAGSVAVGEAAWETAPSCLPDTLASTPLPDAAACKSMCASLKAGEPAGKRIGGSPRQTSDPPPDRKNYSGAEIRFARFERLDLSKADFRCATISDTDFKDSLLDQANFTCATMNGVRFEGRSMNLAKFHSASLLHTDFVAVRAYQSDFTCARLQETDLTKSRLNRISLRAADLVGWGLIALWLAAATLDWFG